MHLWYTNPFEEISIVDGEGCRIWDSQGKVYLDLLSGTWCNVLGYKHPKWIKAVKEQISGLTHIGPQFVTKDIGQGLGKLSEILPPQLDRAVFLNTGSEAVELALKMACAATGKDTVASFERGYYGATTYAMGLSEAGRTATYLPSLGKNLRLPAPSCYRCPIGDKEACKNTYPCLGPLEEFVDKGGEVAAVIYEPVIAGEMLIPPEGYVKYLRELLNRCNGLLIAEEVTTGVGRTGRWFGFYHDDILPDILVIGKAIGAGLPVAVVATTEKVEARCKEVMLRHVQSHQNDPYSGGIAASVIEIMQEEGLVEMAAIQGSYMLEKLKNLQAEIPIISDVRGRGLMLGVELYEEAADFGMKAAKKLLEAGFIVNFSPASRSFRFFPPYIITREEIDSFVDVFKQVLHQSDQ